MLLSSGCYVECQFGLSLVVEIDLSGSVKFAPVLKLRQLRFDSRSKCRHPDKGDLFFQGPTYFLIISALYYERVINN